MNYSDYVLGACLNETSPVAAPTLQSSGANSLPTMADLRAHCSPIEDQGRIGSCAANAVIGAMEYHQIRRGEATTDLSRLFLYYNARKLADNESKDTGTFIHHAMAATLAWGIAPERMWPYQAALWSTRPTEACYGAALSFEAVSYARVTLGVQAKAALAAGLPIVFGACLPAEMLQVTAAKTGRLDPPEDGQWAPHGSGHAMLIVGYDDADQTWLIRNSWGDAWGDGGHARVHFDVLHRYQMPTQFWVIGDIESSVSMKLVGSILAESHSAAGAPERLGEGLDSLRRDVRTQLSSEMDRAKADFKSRLRGR